MKIASILLQFCLITSLIACMNPFSACSHYFENIQVISDANRLTAFSMMVISIEGNFRAIWKIIFFCEWDTFIITCFASSTGIFNMYGLFGLFHVILFQYQGLCLSSWQKLCQICLFSPQINVHLTSDRHSWVCTAVFDYSFVD